MGQDCIKSDKSVEWLCKNSGSYVNMHAMKTVWLHIMSLYIGTCSSGSHIAFNCSKLPYRHNCTMHACCPHPFTYCQELMSDYLTQRFQSHYSTQFPWGHPLSTVTHTVILNFDVYLSVSMKAGKMLFLLKSEWQSVYLIEIIVPGMNSIPTVAFHVQLLQTYMIVYTRAGCEGGYYLTKY